MASAARPAPAAVRPRSRPPDRRRVRPASSWPLLRTSTNLINTPPVITSSSIFLRDTCFSNVVKSTGGSSSCVPKTTLVSLGVSGAIANGPSYEPTMDSCGLARCLHVDGHQSSELCGRDRRHAPGLLAGSLHRGDQLPLRGRLPPRSFPSPRMAPAPAMAIATIRSSVPTAAMWRSYRSRRTWSPRRRPEGLTASRRRHSFTTPARLCLR